MESVFEAGKRAMGKFGAVGVAAAIVATLSAGALCAPAQAQASSELSAATPQLTAQATSSKAIAKTAKSNATTIIKKAKATKGTSTEKLKKIYAYVAKDKSMGGVYQSESYLTFYMKYGSGYYPAKQEMVKSSLMKTCYKKYAVDMFKDKKGSCYNYAALFAVAAKQALGKSATVKIAVGSSKHAGYVNPYHAWTEITLGKKVYIYDPQAGNFFSKNAKSATNYGKFCGTAKSKLKANYVNYKGAKYTTVTL